MNPPAVAVVAGSGLSLETLLDELHSEIPFTAIPGLAACSVTGHVGRFLVGRSGGQSVIVQQGRLHVYEGLTVRHVDATVDALYRLGARTIVFTNAAGGLRPGVEPGALLAVNDIAVWPYRHWPCKPERIVPSFRLDGCDAHGVYVWVHGPSYESRAEIAAMRRMGYDAVGMSTAPEMARALVLGMDAAAVSCITHDCGRPGKLTHEHVVATARSATGRLSTIVREFIRTRTDTPRDV